MKKLVSLLLALVVCVSLFSATAVAFAADDTISHSKDAAKKDLVGAWYDDNGSRIKVKDKEFDGTLQYREDPKDDSSTLKKLSVDGKYAYSSDGQFKQKLDEDKDDKDESKTTWTVDFVSKQLIFTVTVKVEKSDQSDDQTDEPQEPEEPKEPEYEEKVYTIKLLRHTITCNQDEFGKLNEVTTDPTVNVVQGARKDFQFNYAWLLNESLVETIFPGISYTLRFGDWTAEIGDDGLMNITWTLHGGTEYTAKLKKETKEESEPEGAAEGETTAADFVGTWKSEDLAGKSVELVFTSTHVTVERNNRSLGRVTYTVEDGAAKFTTGDSAKPYAVADESDKILVQYATPTIDYKDFASWNTVEIGTDINVIGTTSSTSRLGWWVFRFVVRDSNGTVLTNDQGEEIRSERIDIYFSDTSEPEYRDNDGLTSDMISSRDNGLTVGSTYTIKTNLRYIDNGTVTVNYTVYKLNTKTNKWVPILVKGEEVAEGYEDCITAAGVITPKESDILKGNKPIYRIVYTLTDDQLYTSAPTTLELFVKAAEEETTISGTEVWKIILYVIAGLSAVGIVVVLCIKPKQPQTEDARVAGIDATGESKSDRKSDATQEDSSDSLDE